MPTSSKSSTGSSICKPLGRLPLSKLTLFASHRANESACSVGAWSGIVVMTTSTSLTPPYPQGIGATWSVPMDTDARDLHFFLDLLAAIQATYAVDIALLEDRDDLRLGEF